MMATIIAILFAVIFDLLAGRMIDNSGGAESTVIAHHNGELATVLDAFASDNDQTGNTAKKDTKHAHLRSIFQLQQTKQESNAGQIPTESDERLLTQPEARGPLIGLPEQDDTLIPKNPMLRMMNAAHLERLTEQFPRRKIAQTKRNPRFSHFAKLPSEWIYASSVEKNEPKTNQLSHNSLVARDHSLFGTGSNGAVENANDKQFQKLDNLDDIMMKEQNFVNSTLSSSCAEPKLDFCGDAVRYPITQAQMSVHNFYDGLAEAALDFLTIQTKGKVGSCKQELKYILCRDRFPRCEGNTVRWGSIREQCGRAIASCPIEVQEILRNMDLCRKLGGGDSPIDKCIPAIQSKDGNDCQLEKGAKVAPWNKHAPLEVHNLIEIQKTLFQINGNCLKKLNDYLCLPSKLCYSSTNFSRLTSAFHKQCKDTLKACENTMFSKGMQVFFKCK